MTEVSDSELIQPLIRLPFLVSFLLPFLLPFLTLLLFTSSSLPLPVLIIFTIKPAIVREKV